MTVSISTPDPTYATTECDYVTLARSNYDTADAIVSVLDINKKAPRSQRKQNVDALRGLVQACENNLWEALSRDYPQFRFRRQNQTIVVSYNTSGQTVTINQGEVYKIKSWGVNDYYEALDTINRLETQLYNNGIIFNRRWMDDWKRLGNQLVAIDRRNCKGFAEPAPGPVIITPGQSIPKPPAAPGPDIAIYPLPPIPAQGSWSTFETRNWSITGWDNSFILPMAGNYQTTRPTIVRIAGRDLIYYAPNGTNTTKLVWLFHGTGSTARGWFVEYEKIKYIKKLTDAGYAVAAYESHNRISKKWALTSNVTTNREVIDMLACQSFLAQVGILKRTCTAVAHVNPQTGQVVTEQSCYWNTTQYGVGMSSGAALLNHASGILGITKVIMHNFAGVSQIIRNPNYNVKTLWMLSANDIGMSNTEATNNYSYLLTNKPSLTVGLYNQDASKITSAIFDAVPDVSTGVADAIVAGLISAGFIQSDGTVTNKFSSASGSLRETYSQVTLPTIIATAFGGDVTNYRLHVGDIVDQIRISFSAHQFSGWQRNADGTLTDRDLAFLDA